MCTYCIVGKGAKVLAFTCKTKVMAFFMGSISGQYSLLRNENFWCEIKHFLDKELLLRAFSSENSCFFLRELKWTVLCP